MALRQVGTRPEGPEWECTQFRLQDNFRSNQISFENGCSGEQHDGRSWVNPKGRGMWAILTDAICPDLYSSGTQIVILMIHLTRTTPFSKTLSECNSDSPDGSSLTEFP
jgi:hypothetical protein